MLEPNSKVFALTTNRLGLDDVIEAVAVEGGRAAAKLAEAEHLVHHGVGGQVGSGRDDQAIVPFTVHTICAVPVNMDDDIRSVLVCVCARTVTRIELTRST